MKAPAGLGEYLSRPGRTTRLPRPAARPGLLGWVNGLCLLVFPLHNLSRSLGIQGAQDGTVITVYLPPLESLGPNDTVPGHPLPGVGEGAPALTHACATPYLVPWGCCLEGRWSRARSPLAVEGPRWKAFPLSPQLPKT